MKSTIVMRGVCAALLAGLGSLSAAQAANGTTLNRSDQHILTELAQANLAEIDAAKIAQQKTSNDQVRSFAQQMIDDHGKALQQVRQLAQARGVTLPTEPDRKSRALDAKLNNLNGPAFDRTYLARAGVADHERAHKMLAKAESRASDPDLKALVAQMQPVVDEHLNRVEQLAQAGPVSARGNRASSGNTDNPLNPNNQATHPAKPSGQ